MLPNPPYADSGTRQVPGPCLIPPGHQNLNRYGQRKINGRAIDAHRVAWIAVHGAIPRGKVVRHAVCDTPACVNVAHLRLGTMADNTRDMIARGRAGWQRYPDLNKGGRNGRAVLTETKVAIIRALVRAGAQKKRLAATFGLSESALGKAANGRSWRHVE